MSAVLNNETTQSANTTPACNQESCQSNGYVSPEVNIYETKQGYVLQAEMPGVAKESLDVSLEANTLTILGKRVTQPTPGEALYRESSQADYRRVFELDPAIDTDKVSAHIEQGVVTIHLPKSERLQPRKVAVND